MHVQYFQYIHQIVQHIQHILSLDHIFEFFLSYFLRSISSFHRMNSMLTLICALSLWIFDFLCQSLCGFVTIGAYSADQALAISPIHMVTDICKDCRSLF